MDPKFGYLVCYRSSVALVALVAVGCGGEERVRHQISGTVTYQGKPVEMGTIRFEADASVGNFAPACQAPIKNGSFQTPLEESPGAGKYHVRVLGIDVPRIVKSTGPGIPDEMPALFFPYTTTVEIPPPDGTLEIQVPESRR